jgi:hypothetical protein
VALLKWSLSIALCFCALLAAARIAGAQDLRPGETNVMLCDSPEHAVAYAVALDDVEVEDMAKDVVGKAAGREVCDKFIGQASPGEQRTLLEKGISYKVTAYKFDGVGAMRWSAIPQN